MAKILVVDDDENIRELVRMYLEKDGHEVMFASDGSMALNVFRDADPDMVLLDVMLPLIGGFEVCRMIKAQKDIPVIMLTAKDAGDDKVTGFESGADDYLVKPFDPKELLVRIKARMRGTGAAQKTSAKVVSGGIVIDIDSYSVECEGLLIDMTPKEIQLLHYFMLNPGRVFSREHLLTNIWGFDYAGETRTVDMHVRRLREKLTEKEAIRIKTIYGVGYKLEPQS